MTITLSNLKPAPHSHKHSKRIGRGNAGRGSYSGKGIKGQKARTGGRAGLKRLGLKMIMQRIPKKRGFTSLTKKSAVVNLETIARVFSAGGIITPALLVKAGLIQNARAGVKVLGGGALVKDYTIKGCLVSESARGKIEKAGGHIEN